MMKKTKALNKAAENLVINQSGKMDYREFVSRLMDTPQAKQYFHAYDIPSLMKSPKTGSLWDALTGKQYPPRDDNVDGRIDELLKVALFSDKLCRNDDGEIYFDGYNFYYKLCAPSDNFFVRMFRLSIRIILFFILLPFTIIKIITFPYR